MKTRIVLLVCVTLLSIGCPAPKPALKITEPIEGALVDPIQMVRGSSRGVPAGQAIWVFVFVQKVNRYYPQNQPADLQANGGWSSMTSIGIASDLGLKFDLIAVLADDEGRSAINNYLTNAKNRNDYPGVEQLPTGVTVYDRISVTRK